GVRIETACYTNYTKPPYYDSMVAKLIIHEPTRYEAIMAGIRALSEFVVLGIDTSRPFHFKLLYNQIFRSGKFNTYFLEQYSIMNDEG
ncbi:acetyl-CoA carboxylase biotin carboxylase subunit, partial [Staphylococcus aureus]|nr:acetyl-CoA carboxylase biotin carboxylase subunit [Staphylococcus aureus]